jgi:hypothetical protein
MSVAGILTTEEIFMRVYLMYFMFALGLLFYLSNFPERFVFVVSKSDIKGFGLESSIFGFKAINCGIFLYSLVFLYILLIVLTCTTNGMWIIQEVCALTPLLEICHWKLQ